MRVVGFGLVAGIFEAGVVKGSCTRLVSSSREGWSGSTAEWWSPGRRAAHLHAASCPFLLSITTVQGVPFRGTSHHCQYAICYGARERSAISVGLGMLRRYATVRLQSVGWLFLPRGLPRASRGMRVGYCVQGWQYGSADRALARQCRPQARRSGRRQEAAVGLPRLPQHLSGSGLTSASASAIDGGAWASRVPPAIAPSLRGRQRRGRGPVTAGGTAIGAQHQLARTRTGRHHHGRAGRRTLRSWRIVDHGAWDRPPVAGVPGRALQSSLHA